MPDNINLPGSGGQRAWQGSRCLWLCALATESLLAALLTKGGPNEAPRDEKGAYLIPDRPGLCFFLNSGWGGRYVTTNFAHFEHNLDFEVF